MSIQGFQLSQYMHLTALATDQAALTSMQSTCTFVPMTQQ